MRWPLWLASVAVALFVADRLLLAAEARRWIYWRRRRASADALGNALVHLQSIVEPRAERLAETREAEEAADESSARAQGVTDISIPRDEQL